MTGGPVRARGLLGTRLLFGLAGGLVGATALGCAEDLGPDRGLQDPSLVSDGALAEVAFQDLTPEERRSLADSAALQFVRETTLRYLEGSIERAAERTETTPWEISIETEGDPDAWAGLGQELLSAVGGRPMVGSDRRYVALEIEEYRRSPDTVGFAIRIGGYLKCDTPPVKVAGAMDSRYVRLVLTDPDWEFTELPETSFGAGLVCFRIHRH